MAKVLSDLKMEFGTKEASLTAHVEQDDRGMEACLARSSAQRFLTLLELLPHGVIKMSHDLEGLVSVSPHLGVACEREHEGVPIAGFSRSFLDFFVRGVCVLHTKPFLSSLWASSTTVVRAESSIRERCVR